ncbi:MAG TPA: bifunctional phosphoglucose/phosphomannose isomerase [Cryomorphaceae bacterium]|nr:bifunctional phosphoglucose/phosphomannose isomerase [Cryomorphaceae bacterium]
MTKEEAITEMERLIDAFPDNMVEAIEIGKRAAENFKPRRVSNVLISGLGGSGIGGKYASQLVWDQCSVPIQVVNDYRIPAWVGEDTLFVACSYSGNTEETLSTLAEAMAKGASISCVTSGGKLELLARENDFNMIKIPGGQPPRTSFGYNALQQLFILSAYDLIGKEFMTDLSSAAQLLKNESGLIKAEASAIANKIGNKIPVVYAETYFEAVAIRFRQQINENAKTLCWHHALPEMNHNELVAWAGGSQEYAVLMIRTPEDHPRTAKRMELSKEIIARYTDGLIELKPKGASRIEMVYYLTHLVDWVSYYMAVEKDVDPIEIEVIDYFKAQLAKG